MKKTIKKITFCQGDKKELEEITGEEYDYLDYQDVKTIRSVNKDIPKMHSTFIETELDLGIANNLYRIKFRMYEYAMELDADAIIHYTTHIYTGESGTIEGYTRGTFLKKKIKK
ncbi:MAG: hypothetical protein KAI43_10420 [Candidatus Aureabacteria bacterium]|nr:hypothetical protein [Candidatus Auribacterota bacterium]